MGIQVIGNGYCAECFHLCKNAWYVCVCVFVSVSVCVSLCEKILRVLIFGEIYLISALNLCVTQFLQIFFCGYFLLFSNFEHSSSFHTINTLLDIKPQNWQLQNYHIFTIGKKKLDNM